MTETNGTRDLRAAAQAHMSRYPSTTLDDLTYIVCEVSMRLGAQLDDLTAVLLDLRSIQSAAGGTDRAPITVRPPQ